MSYTKELEDGLQRLQAELDSVRNDVRLSNGAYAIADANIALLKGENDELRRQLTEAQSQLSQQEKHSVHWLNKCGLVENQLTATQAREKALVGAVAKADSLIRKSGVFAYISAHAERLRRDNRDDLAWGDETFAAIKKNYDDVELALELLSDAALAQPTPASDTADSAQPGDAKRLDWLEKNSPFDKADIHYRWVRFKWFYFRDPLRAAIDAAMRAKETTL